jgi:hypothetical protein
MNHGAKVLMVWLQGVLSTTSGGHASQSGSFILTMHVSANLIGVLFLKLLTMVYGSSPGGLLLAFLVVHLH